MSLSKIIASVQMICEAIASVVNIDVTIVDEKRVRLAGTGRYKESVGSVVSDNSAFCYALKENVGFIIENPGAHQACQNCDSKDKCTEHAEVCCPIRLEGNPIGVIGLIAFTEDRRNALIDNQKNLMSFLDRMADLIASKLKEHESHEALEMLASELEVIIDSLDTSLIECDRSGHILRVNQKYVNVFGKKFPPQPEHLSDLFIDKEVLRILSMRTNEKNQYYTFDGGIQGVYDVMPIKVSAEIRGYLITIRSIEEVLDTVSEMMLDSAPVCFDHIIGQSESIVQAKSLAAKFATSASTVLILGESGTGKELFARAIHHASKRAKMPFVAINCAAIPDHLLESELFGYEEGAFSGARRGGKPGKFQLANHGTLFLDEIGDMPLHLQSKILRAIQEKQIDRLGSGSPIEVDVRIIAATHQDLEAKVLEGTFRQDLYYRLNVIPIQIPALRERKDDLLLTTEYMVKKWSQKFDKKIPKISDEFLGAIQAHNWPGNVRELENAVEYAINLCDEDLLQAYHLPKRLRAVMASQENQAHQDHETHLGRQRECVDSCKSQFSPFVDENGKVLTIEALEKAAIDRMIAQYGSSGEGLMQVAKQLGISRATLYRKLKLKE